MKALDIYQKINQPHLKLHWSADLLFVVPRIVGGYLLATMFGASKFGLPWSPAENNLGLFEVAYWFPGDVAAFGGIFALFPVFFAWMGAFSEAVGGLLFAVGFQTRLTGFLIMCTMFVAMFFQKFDSGVWSMLPAAGFFWVGLYNVVLGGGRFSIDNIINNYLTKEAS